MVLVLNDAVLVLLIALSRLGVTAETVTALVVVRLAASLAETLLVEAVDVAVEATLVTEVGCALAVTLAVTVLVRLGVAVTADTLVSLSSLAALTEIVESDATLVRLAGVADVTAAVA